MKLLDKFRNMPLRFKLLIVYVGLFSLTIISATLVSRPLVRRVVANNIESELANTTAAIVNMVGSTANASIKNYLRATAEENKQIVQHIYEQYQAGELTKEEAKRLAGGILLSQTIGKTGYIYILNSNGVLEVHPKKPLRNANISKYGFVQEQIRRKEGYLEYEWKNPGESKDRPKALYMTYFEPWDWIISASSYREEFKSLINVKDFRDSILSIRFGKTGYPYVIDTHGTLIVHPKLEGTNIIDSEDAGGRKFIKELCEKKSGRIVYPWQNPGEPAPREKLVLFDYIPEFDWIVASSSYLEEFYAPLVSLRVTIGLTLLGALLLLLPLTLWVSSTITRRLKQLKENFSVAAEGDLSVRVHDHARDEVGQLALYFNDLMAKLEAEITERQQAENALKKSEQTMSDIINFFPDATMVIDQDGIIIAWNHAMEQMTGVSAPDMLGKGDREYSAPFYGERRPILIDLVTVPDEELEAGYAEVGRRGDVLFGEGFVNNLPGGRRYLSATAIALRDPQGKVFGAIEAIRDITERKQTDDELQKYRENLEEIVHARTAELQKVTEEAQEARRAAETANKAKSVFLSTMSHELRTPLNAVLGFSELMMRDPQLSGEQRGTLETINRSGDHLLAIINDVLEMSKIEAGRTTLAKSSFNLYSMIDSVADMFRLLASRRGLKIIVQLDKEVPGCIKGDEAKLRQVLINLLGNAVKFTAEGHITLRIQKDDGAVAKGEGLYLALRFEVEDTGPGIPQKDLHKLFDAFCQTEAGQFIQGGTGLGLTISQKFVQLMGGDITVTSPVKNGQGACFAFVVKVEPADQTEIAGLHPVNQKRIAGLEQGHPRYRILLVDDKESNRQLLIKMLQPLGFEMREAVNGREAMDIWRTFKPRLIWMDLRMPVMDGYEAARQIRATEADHVLNANSSEGTGGPVQRTVIIAISASALDIQSTEDLPREFDDFLRKPFREAELFRLMQKHLDLRFTYDEAVSYNAEDTIDIPAGLRKLPSGLLLRLRDAVEVSDTEEMAAVLDEVAGYDSGLAHIMRRKANNFEFDLILALISSAE